MPAPVMTMRPAESKAKTPVIPRVPARPPAVSPSGWSAVPILANPRIVRVTRTVDHDPFRADLRPEIAWGVPFVDRFRIRTENPNVGQVVKRRGNRDRINHWRNGRGHHPGLG